VTDIELAIVSGVIAGLVSGILLPLTVALCARWILVVAQRWAE